MENKGLQNRYAMIPNVNEIIYTFIAPMFGLVDTLQLNVTVIQRVFDRETDVTKASTINNK